jgi:hypothetical protein
VVKVEHICSLCIRRHSTSDVCVLEHLKPQMLADEDLLCTSHPVLLVFQRHHTLVKCETTWPLTLSCMLRVFSIVI